MATLCLIGVESARAACLCMWNFLHDVTVRGLCGALCFALSRYGLSKLLKFFPGPGFLFVTYAAISTA